MLTCSLQLRFTRRNSQFFKITLNSPFFITVYCIKTISFGLQTHEFSVPCYWILFCSIGIFIHISKKFDVSMPKPLHTLFNLAISTNTFHIYTKITHTCSIHKPGSSNVISHWTPVSLFPNFVNGFKTLFCNIIYSSVKPFVSSYQHSFIKNQFTVSTV